MKIWRIIGVCGVVLLAFALLSPTGLNTIREFNGSRAAVREATKGRIYLLEPDSKEYASPALIPWLDPTTPMCNVYTADIDGLEFSAELTGKSVSQYLSEFRDLRLPDDSRDGDELLHRFICHDGNGSVLALLVSVESGGTHSAAFRTGFNIQMRNIAIEREGTGFPE